MDKLNPNLYVEQVTYNTNSTVPVFWEGNEELALSEVVDPNTEFKSKINEKSEISVSPVESYGLTELLQNPEQNIILDNVQQTLDSNPLVFQIEAAITGGIESKLKLATNDNSTIPQVHAYVSTHSMSSKETTVQTMEHKNVCAGANNIPSTLAHSETQGKLYKYPSERITVFTERRGYLTNSSTVQQDGYQSSTAAAHTALDKSSTLASSNDSVDTLGEEPESRFRRDSIYSTKSLNSANSVNCGLDRSAASTTTTDQLVWAFRTARDRLDTASNISECSSHFELDSNCSERVETVSTISDVSGYEEEMYRIRRLLLLDSPTPSMGNKHHFKYEDHSREQNIKPKTLFDLSDNTRKLDFQSPQGEIDLLHTHRLSVQLQNALAEKEKYRVELVEVETKVALEWQEQYNEILRQKAHTEGRLEIVQAELEALRSERQCVLDHARAVENEARTKSVTKRKALLQEIEKLTLEQSSLQQLIRELEQQKQELNLQIELKDSEISRWKEEIQELESYNEKLRIEMQELRVEIESKDGAIHGLKEKVADQHVEFQSLFQAKLKAENNLTCSKNEIESIRESGHWYRDQLHLCQADKVKVQQELMTSQSNLVSHSHLVEKLKCENARLHQLVKDTQQRAVREKELLMRKLEVIQADMMEREAAILGQIHREDVTSETITSISAKLRKIEEDKENHANVSLKELEEQKEALTNELHSRDASIKNIETENAQLMMRITTLQKTLNEKELVLQGIENKHRHMEMAYNQTNESLKFKEQTLLDIKNEKVTIEVALAAAKKEKVEVDSAICKLREDFARITKGYRTMKTEIRNKDKHIENVEMELQEHVRIKQALYIEIEELKKVKEEFKTWQGKILNIEKMEQEIDLLVKRNSELQGKVLEFTEVRNHMQENLSRLEEKLAFREQQLMSQTQSFEVYSEEQNARDKKIMDENRSMAEVNEKLKSKVEQVETMNANLLKQLESHKRQVSRADGVIDQFNALCRGSEQEKHYLDKQLKKVLKELKEAQIKSEIKSSLECNFDSQESSAPETNDAMLGQSQAQSNKQIENRYVQTNLHLIQELAEKNFKKAVLLVSDKKSTTLNQIGDKSDPTCTGVTEFTAISTRLTELSNYLDKAIDERKRYLTELEKKVQVRDKLEFKVVKLKDETNKRFAFDEKKHSNTNSIVPVANESHVGTSAVEIHDNNLTLRIKEQLLSCQKEVEKLKGLLKMTEVEQREKHRRYESNIRTLLKKVKEHMRGRKVAERTVEALRCKVEGEGMSDTEALQLEVKKLETELETSRRQYEEQKRIAEKSQLTLLELEKERGKLVQSQDVLKEQRTLTSNLEEHEASITLQFDQQTRELQLQQIQRRVAELEQETSSQSTIIRELKKKVFAEKCENSQLRKQLASVRMGLDAANEMLDNKNIEVGRNETWRQLLTRKHSDVQKMLELEQIAHEECREELLKIKAELEETRAKDPVLADQIKTLSYHLHQKSQEAAGLQEKLLLAEDRWLTIESGLQQSVCVLQDEVASLRSELDSISRNKLLFQTQAAELRAALHSSLERNKMLKLKLEAYNCDSSKERLPDLTSSLPLPPSKYDEAQIAELLHQSTVLPNNKPLSNLQSCLDSLKQEMATLQMQLTAKTSGYTSPVIDDVANHKLEHYGVQNI